MTLRCKPGDLALVTGRFRETGKMVTCIRLEDNPRGGDLGSYTGKTWRVDMPMAWQTRGQAVITEYNTPHWPDCYLLPIKPEPDPEGDYDEQEKPRDRLAALKQLQKWQKRLQAEREEKA